MITGDKNSQSVHAVYSACRKYMKDSDGGVVCQHTNRYGNYVYDPSEEAAHVSVMCPDCDKTIDKMELTCHITSEALLQDLIDFAVETAPPILTCDDLGINKSLDLSEPADLTCR